MTCRVFRMSYYLNFKNSRKYKWECTYMGLRVNDKTCLNNLCHSQMRNFSVKRIMSSYTPSIADYLAFKIFGPLTENQMYNVEPNYTREGILERFNQAIITTSQLISKGQLDELNGIVFEPLVYIIRNEVTDSQKQQILKIDESTLIKTIMLDVSIALGAGENGSLIKIEVGVIAAPKKKENSKVYDLHIYQFQRFYGGRSGLFEEWLVTNMHVTRWDIS